MAHDSQIVKAKENLKLSRGGLSYSLASGTNPPVKALRLIQFKNFFKRSIVAILVELEAKDLVDLVEPSSMVRAANALTISSEPSLTIFLFYFYILPDPLSSIIDRCTLYIPGCRMKAYK